MKAKDTIPGKIYSLEEEEDAWSGAMMRTKDIWGRFPTNGVIFCELDTGNLYICDGEVPAISCVWKRGEKYVTD